MSERSPKDALEAIHQTTFDQLTSPDAVVDFVEKLLTLNERHQALHTVLPNEPLPTFQELKDDVDKGKVDLHSADFVNAERQLLETAALFPNDPRFQAMTAGRARTLAPHEVSMRGIIEGLHYAKHDKDKHIDLRGVDLSFMDLSDHNLHASQLSGAKLDNAVLRHTDLTQADLSQADLREADLSHADLRGATLTGIKAQGALFYGAKLDPDAALIITEAGGLLTPPLVSS